MQMMERLPNLADQELKHLLANARRLAETGTAKQQAEARALEPLIEAEIAGRKPASAAKIRKPKRPAKASQA